MTIGIGFLCDDGIVLCSDNQITYEDSHKFYQCKLDSYISEGCQVVFTYAGSPDFMKSFYGKFRDHVQQTSQSVVTARKVQDAIETVLYLFDTPDAQGTSIIAGVVVPDSEMKLFRTNGRIVGEVSNYDYVGIGDSSLLRYLRPIIAGTTIKSVHQALSVGVYLVYAAKRYIDGCGGDTDAMVLRPTGTIETRSSSTSNIEQSLGMIEILASKAAESFFDGSQDQKEFEERVARLCRKLKDERSELRFARPSIVQ
jgi:20S proteasome alpha/beta subunit